MGLTELEEDKYINCYYYILEANYLYNNIKNILYKKIYYNYSLYKF